MIGRKESMGVLAAMEGKRVLVLGDLMLDRYVVGSVGRISPEAPVPVVRVKEEHSLPGGAANVALNIQALGGHAVLAGVTGDDAPGAELLDMLSAKGISTDGVLRDAGVTTTVKTRIIAERQQVVRVDYEDPPGIVAESLGGLRDRIQGLVDGVSGVIIEDYGKGAVSQEVVDVVLAAARDRGLPVGLDPKDNHELQIEGVTLATPNFREAALAVLGREVALGEDAAADSRLADVAGALAEKWHTELLVITLGPQGMYLLGRSGGPVIIPTKAREVFDVSGAGDTVIAVCLLAMTTGVDPIRAAMLANYAAGVVVGKLGASTCTAEELLAAVG